MHLQMHLIPTGREAPPMAMESNRADLYARDLLEDDNDYISLCPAGYTLIRELSLVASSSRK